MLNSILPCVTGKYSFLLVTCVGSCWNYLEYHLRQHYLKSLLSLSVVCQHNWDLWDGRAQFSFPYNTFCLRTPPRLCTIIFKIMRVIPSYGKQKAESKHRESWKLPWHHNFEHSFCSGTETVQEKLMENFQMKRKWSRGKTYCFRKVVPAAVIRWNQF